MFHLLRDSGIYYYDLYLEIAKASDINQFPFFREVFAPELRRLKYKLNKVFIHPMMAQKLDEGSIDYDIIDHLKQWKRLFNQHDDPYIILRRLVYDQQYTMQPTTIALLDENITYWNKYTQRVSYEHYIYHGLLEQVLREQRQVKLNTLFKRLYSKFYYSVFKSFIFGIDYWSIGKKKYKYMVAAGYTEFSSREYLYGLNLKWDVPLELYKGEYNKRFYDLQNATYSDNLY